MIFIIFSVFLFICYVCMFRSVRFLLCCLRCVLGCTLMSQASFWSLMFVVLAVCVGAAFIVQVSSFTLMGTRLTTRLQKITFAGEPLVCAAPGREERRGGGCLSVTYA